ncbi:integration host factor, actinobacterial type [Actinocrispum wychmicini]|uniref:Integration host factor-like helix-two turn-helix domain-containing protein n=1 Tax=Actinocrispum wychmicini TaxID=1213861 RepID=A0A4R2IIV4_9PSEU|nr:integration host factor, actinobacterial type [Actinocrispum wychmicini]TCO43749.1 hypothetical protein EV192_12812 [Actinocrispum wychmicini]
MAPPSLTTDERQAALAKALHARTARSELLTALKTGTITLNDLLAKADNGDHIVLRTPVLAAVKVLPGFGLTRARKLLERNEISLRRRIRGLGNRQREALLAAITVGRDPATQTPSAPRPTPSTSPGAPR